MPAAPHPTPTSLRPPVVTRTPRTATRLTRLLTSSIGKKYVMGMTGLLLCGFLVTHLSGNLLIFRGADAYNEYAAKLHSLGPLLWAAEIGLLVLFVVHIGLAIWLTVENRAARGRQGYENRDSKQNTSILNAAPRSWMFISGSVVLVFLLLHLADMRFGLRDTFTDFAYPAEFNEGPEGSFDAGRPEVLRYERSIAILRTPLSATVYVVGVLFLGFHLSHGFASAFRSLGVAHPVYTPIIYYVGIAFSVIIAVGFASLPIYVWAFDVQVPNLANAPERVERQLDQEGIEGLPGDPQIRERAKQSQQK